MYKSIKKETKASKLNIIAQKKYDIISGKYDYLRTAFNTEKELKNSTRCKSYSCMLHGH